MKIHSQDLQKETIQVFKKEQGREPDHNVLQKCLRAWWPFYKSVNPSTDLQQTLELAGAHLNRILAPVTRTEVALIRSAICQAVKNIIEDQ